MFRLPTSISRSTKSIKIAPRDSFVASISGGASLFLQNNFQFPRDRHYCFPALADNPSVSSCIFRKLFLPTLLFAVCCVPSTLLAAPIEYFATTFNCVADSTKWACRSETSFEVCPHRLRGAERQRESITENSGIIRGNLHKSRPRKMGICDPSSSHRAGSPVDGHCKLLLIASDRVSSGIWMSCNNVALSKPSMGTQIRPREVAAPKLRCISRFGSMDVNSSAAHTLARLGGLYRANCFSRVSKPTELQGKYTARTQPHRQNTRPPRQAARFQIVGKSPGVELRMAIEEWAPKVAHQSRLFGDP